MFNGTGIQAPVLQTAPQMPSPSSEAEQQKSLMKMSPPDNNSSFRNRDSWSRYWALQPDHSLPGTFDAGYGQAISSFWQGIAQRLPDTASVLDLATGNGPLPRLLLHWRPDLSIDGIDAAQIAPTWLPPNKAALPRFHSHISCEALPFSNASFDLVTSQYGIEYSDLNRSLAEVARTLRADGIFAAVIHSSGSRIVDVGRDEIAHVRLLTAPGGAVEQVRKMAKLMPAASTSEGRRQLDASPSARSTRDEFNNAMTQVRAAATVAIAPDLLFEFLRWVPQVLALAGNEPDATSALHECQRHQLQLEDAGERYDALLKAAMSTTQQAQLASYLATFDLHLEGVSDLKQDGHLLGIAISARRR
ncbi:class I SAM-dependent methyltransferase [uncultured Stenotrophomonas sp.]|uniref:class I SAM-dependent methyltransferase n=1 Tax=uncultured Stenotrophomonas sp. TaxID=165438 RepID=UPI0025DF13A9|nr:class I SAM-dependent methyltransferase [uncultured Stenotrophomonas sp.]